MNKRVNRSWGLCGLDIVSTTTMTDKHRAPSDKRETNYKSTILRTTYCPNRPKCPTNILTNGETLPKPSEIPPEHLGETCFPALCQSRRKEFLPSEHFHLFVLCDYMLETLKYEKVCVANSARHRPLQSLSVVPLVIDSITGRLLWFSSFWLFKAFFTRNHLDLFTWRFPAHLLPLAPH